MPKINMINGDCMEEMAKMPDKAYELAIVDPPYGDGGGNNGTERNAVASEDGSQSTISKSQSRIRRTVRKVARTGGTWSRKYQIGGCFDQNDIRHWDTAPTDEYFKELFRVSKNQIIWGGNYFGLPPNRNFIIWKKLTISEGFSMAMAEYAWCSIQGNSKIFECAPQDSKRFHPTQKPVKLYSWLLQNYAKPGDRILDTHGGSGSICIAAHDLGYDLDWMELDKDYYDAAVKRYEKHKSQPDMFQVRKEEIIQEELI